MKKPTALILCGDGINCENETAEAFQLVGFNSEIKHLNDLIRDCCNMDSLCRNYAALALPGGFSFGDDLSSGKVLALKIIFGLKWDLKTYVQKGGLVIGICNGFQALIRTGIFSKSISITSNESGKYLNTWVRVTPRSERCVWLKGMGTIDIPIRHAEGRLVIQSKQKKEVFGKLERQGMICLQYEMNPNGSVDQIAGLCDPTGRIFGLMPHPEAFVRWTAHPEWTSQPTRAGAPGDGLIIFENAFKEAKGALS